LAWNGTVDVWLEDFLPTLFPDNAMKISCEYRGFRQARHVIYSLLLTVCDVELCFVKDRIPKRNMPLFFQLARIQDNDSPKQIPNWTQHGPNYSRATILFFGQLCINC
jgi:hypothetical protein